MRRFKVGQQVVVYNQRLDGKPIVEGFATIVGPAGDGVEHYYKVKFDGDSELGNPETVCRFVFDGEGQDDPTAFMLKAVAAWLETQQIYQDPPSEI